MNQYAALDVSTEQTAICVVDEHGRVTTEKKVATCPEAITTWLFAYAPDVVRVGMETGPLAVWLWNELRDRGLPIICVDAFGKDSQFFKFYRSLQTYRRALAEAGPTLVLSPDAEFLRNFNTGPSANERP